MVQRYDECEWCGDEYSPDAGMTKSKKGHYVKYADYEKLINSHEKLKTALETILTMKPQLYAAYFLSIIRTAEQALKDSEKPQ